ncbi:heparinase II/III family protein [Halodurantibacterium flavum]|uniref:Heparinase II/III family protein n=1 Tax=Halodurantibacterium flavum TaxID=1382802 RepID=A0ABW4S4Z5_9RHOB
MARPDRPYGVPAPPGLADRIAARLIGFGRSRTRMIAEPEPRFIGSAPRGHALLSGAFHVGGEPVAAQSPWRLRLADPAAQAEARGLHGFRWLDDLAAVGSPAARIAARDWTLEWLTRYGRGAGPGWTATLAAQRLLRWLSHAELLSLPDTARGRFERALGRHLRFLSRRWKAAAPGLERIEVLTAMVYGGLALDGMQPHAERARAGLADAAGIIDAEGAIPSRNPEELLEITHFLLLAATALEEATVDPLPAHLSAIGRAVPVLRVLRHATGLPPRFHGGSRGPAGRLDQVLAASGVRGQAEQPAMGYARLSSGRSTVIADAALPPAGPASAMGHASALAFEFSHGRRSVIVSVGSGAPFGGDWRRAGRATASHSTLGIDGVSSARLAVAAGGPELLTGGPTEVLFRGDRHGLTLAHDGWRRSHGLIHHRVLQLSPDGLSLSGEDVIAAETPPDRAALEQAVARAGADGIGYSMRFHLHPDIRAVADLRGTMVELMLPGGETWAFRHEGEGTLSLQPSVYLDRYRMAPRRSSQIVISDTIRHYTARIGWTLAQAQDRPTAVRDLEPDDLLADA